MLVGTDALLRTVTGTGLKSIGAFCRYGDIPSDHPELKKTYRQREGANLAIIAFTSLVLEGGLALANPWFKKIGLVESALKNPQFANKAVPILEFFPQAVANLLGEIWSRKAYNIKAAFQKNMGTPTGLASKVQFPFANRSNYAGTQMMPITFRAMPPQSNPFYAGAGHVTINRGF
jgi:hypothetical protein